MKIATAELTPVHPGALVVWFALLAGALELAFMAALKLHQHIIFNSDRILWMTPLGYVILFAPLLVLIGGARRMRPGIRWFELAIVVLVAMVSFSFLSLLWGRLGRVPTLLLMTGVTVSTSRSLLAHQAGFSRLVRRTLPWMLGLALLAAVGVTVRRGIREYWGLRTLATGRGTPNVVLLVLDTVRGESMSLYGYPRKTTPALERFATRGVVFDDAYATAPWTLASIATMFTGRYPQEHGADWLTPLSNRDRTVAEAFRDAGYVTAGFAANENYSSSEVGLARGFIHFEDYTTYLSDILLSASPGRFILNNPMLRRTIGFYDSFGRKSAKRLNEAFLTWLEEYKQQPFFAYLNYYDAHEPYLPPSPFDTLFGPDTLRDKSLIRQKGARDTHRIDKEAMTTAERAAEQQAYDASLAYLDFELDRLFAALDRLDLARNTIVIVVGDHGELFGEHSLFTHGNALYLPLLRVPLLIRAPNLPEGVRITTPVTLRDLPRTILDLAGVHDSSMPGKSMVSLAGGASDSATGSMLLAHITPARNIPTSDPVFRGTMWSIISPPHQYIIGGDGKEELYDIVRDPAQSVNLVAQPESRPILERIRGMLDSARRNR